MESKLQMKIWILSQKIDDIEEEYYYLSEAEAYKKACDILQKEHLTQRTALDQETFLMIRKDGTDIAAYNFMLQLGVNFIKIIADEVD